MFVRTWPEQGGSQKYRQGDRQGSQDLKKAIECSFFLAKLGYVIAYAESSTQRQKVRCYSTREKNPHARAHAAHKISTAFDQNKCGTGVRPLHAHPESNRRAMTFLPSKFLPALLLMPILFTLRAAAQEPEDRKPQKPESMGVATGNPHAPVKDALSRPITAGGFVDGAPVCSWTSRNRPGSTNFATARGAGTRRLLSRHQVPAWP